MDRSISRGRSRTPKLVRSNLARSLSKSNMSRIRAGLKDATAGSEIKTKLQHVEGVHGEIKRHVSTILVGKKKPIKNPSKGCWRVTDQGQDIAAIVEGKQFVGTIAFINTFNQMTTSSGAGYNPATNAYVSLFDANPNQSNIGGGLYSQVSLPNDDRIVIRSVQYNLEFANFTAVSPVVIDLYWLLCKKNTNDFPETCWQNVLTSQAMGRSAAVQATNAAAYTAGYASSSMIGMRPEDAPAFKKIWKTLKKETYELAPGANVQLTYDFVYNKMIDKKFIQEQATNYIAGLTLTPFAIFRGCVVKDINGTATVSPCEVGFIYSREYACFVPSANRLQTEFIVPGLITGGASASAVSVIDGTPNITQL